MSSSFRFGAAATITAILGVALVALPHAAHADMLRGYCLNVPAPDCQNTRSSADVTPIVGTNTPNFGFALAGHRYPEAGTFYLDVLIPNNVLIASHGFAISGTGTQYASVFGIGRGDWTGGMLGNFLNRSSSAKDPLGAWLGLTRTFQPAATGYRVFDFDFGTVNFAAANPSFYSKFAFPAGTVIAGFFCAPGQRQCMVASDALMIDSRGTDPGVPEPLSLSLFAAGLFGAGVARRRARRRRMPPRIA